MKLYRNAIILVVVVGLLIGAYFIAGPLINKDSKDNTEETTPETIKITEYNDDSVQTITLINDDGTFVISRQDLGWTLTSPAGLQPDSDILTIIALNATGIMADKLVEEDAKDLTKYGLDKPVQVTIKLKDGSEKTILMGNATPTATGYYIQVKDSGEVYVLGTYTAQRLLIKKVDLLSKTLYTVKPEEIINLSLERNGQKLMKAFKKADSFWNITEPLAAKANLTSIGAINEAISQIAVIEYIEVNPTDLVKYGLDKPLYKIGFDTATAKRTISLGIEKVKGSQIYAMMDGIDAVFIIDETALTFLDKPLKEMVDAFAYLVNVDQVTKVKLVMDGKITTMDFDIYKAADGTSDPDKDKFTVNGKEASMKNDEGNQISRKLFESMIAIIVDEIDIGAVPVGKPEISITYYLKSSPGTMKIEFIPKNSNYYYIKRNGEYAGITTRKDKMEFGIAGMRAAHKTLMDVLDKQ